MDKIFEVAIMIIVIISQFQYSLLFSKLEKIEKKLNNLK